MIIKTQVFYNVSFGVPDSSSASSSARIGDMDVFGNQRFLGSHSKKENKILERVCKECGGGTSEREAHIKTAKKWAVVLILQFMRIRDRNCQLQLNSSPKRRQILLH